MTPSMPGFTFHPQVSTPPSLHPHFLSPGVGPTSPPYHYRNNSFHAAPGAPPVHMGINMMSGMYALHTPGPMVLTPGPRLNPTPSGQQSQQQWSTSAGLNFVDGESATPFVTAPMTGPEEYFPPVPAPPPPGDNTGPEEYFPVIDAAQSNLSGGALPPSLQRSHSAAHSEAETATSTTAADSADDRYSAASSLHDAEMGRQASSDPASTIRKRVAGLALDEQSIVTEIAAASGRGMGTAKKMWATGSSSPSLWMSQKGRFKGGAPSMGGSASDIGCSTEQLVTQSDPTSEATKPAATPSGASSIPRLDKRDFEIDLSNPGLFGLPSPGSGRRASWAESGSRRPTVQQSGDASR